MATESRIFKAGALPRDVLQIGVRLAGTTDPLQLIARPNNLNFSPTEVSDELRSGGRVQDTESVVTSYEWEFEMGGEPLGVLSIFLGAAVVTTGVRPDRVQTLRIKNDVDLPYVEIHVVSLSDGGGTMLTVLERAKLGSMGMDRDYGSFARIPMSGTCVAEASRTDGSIGFLRTYEDQYRLTGIAEEGVEWGNRPFGSRYMAVADTWQDKHVWDYFRYEVPAEVAGSAAAVVDGTLTAIDLEHHAIQDSTLEVSEGGTVIAAAGYTVSETVSGSATAATITALGEVGITVPTMGITPGTLQITRTAASTVPDFGVEDYITVAPDNAGQWQYYPTGISAGSVVMPGLAAGVTVYYQFRRTVARVLFTSGAAVAAGDDLTYKYRPCQEVVTRHEGALSSIDAYVGTTESDNVAANQMAAVSIIQQRGLEARWLDEGDIDYSGRLWIDNSQTGQSTAVTDTDFSLEATGFVRRASQMLLAQGGTSSLEITTYPITANDRIALFAAQINKATVEATTYGMDFALRSIVERGETPTTSGSPGSRQAELRLQTARSRDYFTLVRQSASANEGGARDVFHRAKIRESDQTLAESQFLMIPLTIDAIGYELEGTLQSAVVSKQHFESYTDINLHRI